MEKALGFVRRSDGGSLTADGWSSFPRGHGSPRTPRWERSGDGMRGRVGASGLMATVLRNGRPYSYQSVRRNGRVTSEYRGAGELALIRAQFDAEDATLRKQQRAERRRW